MIFPKLKLKMWLGVFTVTAISAVALVNYPPQGVKQNTADTKTYIIQGASTTSMTKQIASVGADVTHTFSVIDAVSAKLTSSQVAQVNATNPMLRLFANGEVAVNSESVRNAVIPAPNRYSLDSTKLEWESFSRSNNKRFIDEIKINWPTENGKLAVFKINGMDVIKSSISNGSKILSLNARKQQKFYIESDKEIKVELEFEKDIDLTYGDYDVYVKFTDGTNKTFSTTNSTPEQGAHRDTFFPTMVRANEAHEIGITGDGVTVAIIDSGIQSLSDLHKNTYGNDRIKAVYNVLNSSERHKVEDGFGHGTHIASLIGNSASNYNVAGDQTDSYNSIAPGADLVIVKAFDEYGRASYTDILKAIQYVIENSEALNIRVLNLSFSATPSSNYWEDPINQALMVAWKSGITVLAAAGNQGPEAMTIGVPGNNPYVITVGAVSDNYTPYNPNDDFVTTFSSAGPTYEGFVKPEVVAPGGHIQGLLKIDSTIGKNYAMYDDGSDYFLLSGSSQSTAITSGIVALMLQDSPSLTPDEIKCRLVDTAKAAVTDDGQLAFSIFQQGAGLVDAMDALNSSAQDCGNSGLDIDADLAGEQHFMGPAKRHEGNGDFYIANQKGLEWTGAYTDAHMWGNTVANPNAHMWGNAVANPNAHMWGNAVANPNAHMWGNAVANPNAHMWGNAVADPNAHMWGNAVANPNAHMWGNAIANPNAHMWGNAVADPDAHMWGNAIANPNAHMWGNAVANPNAHMWGNAIADPNAHMWGNAIADPNAHMWGNAVANPNAHMWGNLKTNTQSDLKTHAFEIKWVDHE